MPPKNLRPLSDFSKIIGDANFKFQYIFSRLKSDIKL